MTCTVKPVAPPHRLAVPADRPLPTDCPVSFEVGRGDGLWIFTCQKQRGHFGDHDPKLPANPRLWWDHLVEPQGPRPEGDTDD